VQIYGGVFALFSASYLTVQGFLPSVAVETLSMSIATATLLGGASALLVIPGNLVGSFLLSRGVSARLLLRFGFVVMGASGAAFLSDLFAPSVRIAAGCIFTAVAGVVPGVIWALIPQLTAQSRRGSSLTAGVVYQYAGAGQLLGPVLAGLAVQLSGGWSGSAFVVLAASGIAMLIIALPPARIMPEIAGAAPAR
jgi:MFS family permease